MTEETRNIERIWSEKKEPVGGWKQRLYQQRATQLGNDLPICGERTSGRSQVVADGRGEREGVGMLLAPEG